MMGLQRIVGFGHVEKSVSWMSLDTCEIHTRFVWVSSDCARTGKTIGFSHFILTQLKKVQLVKVTEKSHTPLPRPANQACCSEGVDQMYSIKNLHLFPLHFEKLFLLKNSFRLYKYYFSIVGFCITELLSDLWPKTAPRVYWKYANIGRHAIYRAHKGKCSEFFAFVNIA